MSPRLTAKDVIIFFRSLVATHAPNGDPLSPALISAASQSAVHGRRPRARSRDAS